MDESLHRAPKVLALRAALRLHACVALVAVLLVGCSPTYTTFDIHGTGGGPPLHEGLGDEVVLRLRDGSSAQGRLSHVDEDSVVLSLDSSTGDGARPGEWFRASYPRASVSRVVRAEDPQWAGYLAGAVGVGLVLFLAVILAFSTLSPVPG